MNVVEIFSAVCPWLLLVWLFQWAASRCGLRWRGASLLALAGASALVVLVVPIDGIRVARWIAGVAAGFSVPVTAMLAVAVWERAYAWPLLSQAEWTTAWVIGAVGGVALYPLALGLGALDPYEWGWRFSPLFLVVGALTGWLIWSRNRAGLLLLLATIAFHLRLLESNNYWDYLLDPVYCLTSVGVLGARVVTSTRTSLTKRFS